MEHASFELSIRLDESADVSPWSAGVTMAVSVWLPPDHGAQDRTLVMCYPGGGYSKAYFEYAIPGHPGYSMARYLADAGYIVACCDHLGTGASSLPPPASLMWDVIAAANHNVAEQVVVGLRHGTLIDAVPAVSIDGVAGVGHSMGGSLLLIQQALHHTYGAIVTMGTPIKQIVIPFGDGELQEIPTNPLPEGVPDGYLYAGPRPVAFHHAFYMNDVPAAVIAADASTETTILPSAQRMLAPGVLRSYAEAVTVPTLVVFGERDISPAPHSEVEVYTGTGDIGLYILGGSAHCHNLSATRATLWARLVSWIDATLRS
jgi:pimeloyl-ACP methyl ester carboxylesterase